MFPTWTVARASHRALVVRSVLALFLLAGLVVGLSSYRSMTEQVSRQRHLFQTLSPETREQGGVLVVEPWLPGCDRTCAIGYLDFVARHRGGATVVNRQEVKARLALADSMPSTSALGLDAGEMRRRVRQALGVDLLLDGIDQRVLLVGLLRERPMSGVVERRLLFGDPEIGSFEALLLLPTSQGPHPAIIGLHGHREKAEDFSEQYMGLELARHGFVVLMPTLRVHNCKPSETRIAVELLEHGFTLMGLRTYETLLMAKYLRSLGEVDGSRVGIMGHSGGSSVANLAVRLSNGFRAKVTDLPSDYRDRCGFLGIHCETVPALVPLTSDIAAEADLQIPTLEVPYAFEDPTTRAEIARFLDAALSVRE